MSKGLDKFLQYTQQCHALELIYFDDITSLTSEEPILEDAEQASQSSECNPSSAKQKSIEETDSAMNVPESLKMDTSLTSRCLTQAFTDVDEKHQQSMTSESDEHDTDTQQEDDEHTVEDVTREPTSMHSEQLCTMLTCADEVIMPTKKVGCVLVTSHLQQFLENPPPSDKLAFLEFTICYHC